MIDDAREIPTTTDVMQTADHPLRQLSRDLAWLRLIGAAGQALAVCAAIVWLHLPVPVAALMVGVVVLAAGGVFGVWRTRTARPIAPAETIGYFAFDILELAYMLYLTGGSSNPFISLLILPIALAATALPMRHVAIVTALAAAAYGFLIVAHIPLPALHQHDANSEFGAHLVGMAVTFAISAALLAFFVARLATAFRAQGLAIQRERERTLRDERLLAVAIQAAGAAHELNTPLSTVITLVADLRRQHAGDGALCEDLELVATQADRCRDILRELVRTGTREFHDAAAMFVLDDFVADCADRFRLLRPSALLELTPSATPARIRATDDLRYSLINVLNNAWEASRALGHDRIELRAGVDAAHAFIDVRDFGAGLAFDGRTAFFTTKENGLGLGLALASATAERHHGQLLAEPADGGGTRTRLLLPLAERSR
jgi:two-component system sensor histidine kinase RegB